MLEKYDTWKVLELFFKKPTYPFHLREICRILKWSPTKVRDNLNFLKKRNLIVEQKEKNLSIFKSNRENKEFKIYKIIYNLIKAEEIGEMIENSLEDFEAIVFFGSALRGEDIENSDLDFCVIGSKEVEIRLEKMEEALNRKISLIFLENLEKLKKENKELLNNLINGFVVKGYLKVF
ncbi:MAG: nucleotidyltransferase domain-containing protein [Candidatus Aenigmatarchaeota archaeon]